jgi:hypothetical protein
MVRRVAIFLCIAFSSAALILVLLGRRPERSDPADLDARPADGAPAADARPARPAAAVAPPVAPPEASPATKPPQPAVPEARADDVTALPPETIDSEPLVDLDPSEARRLEKYGGHSHAELIAAEETLAREVEVERDRLLRARMANGNFVVVRMGESAPALPLGPDGSEPLTSSTTLTDADGNTEVHIAWLPHAEYPEFYDRCAELRWLQAQLHREEQ